MHHRHPPACSVRKPSARAEGAAADAPGDFQHAPDGQGTCLLCYTRCTLNTKTLGYFIRSPFSFPITSSSFQPQNIRSMISPEERMGVDNVISVMVTVSDVEVSNDLQVVKVFVSILGDERGKQNAIKGLKKMEGYCRRNIGKKVSLRLTPEIRFVYDDSFERGQKVSNLLDDLREEREGRDARGGGYTREELLAVEDTISNPYDDEEDDWEGGHEIIEDDEDSDEDKDADVDIEQVWDEMNKEAGGGDGLIDVK